MEWEKKTALLHPLYIRLPLAVREQYLPHPIRQQNKFGESCNAAPKTNPQIEFIQRNSSRINFFGNSDLLLNNDFSSSRSIDTKPERQPTQHIKES